MALKDIKAANNAKSELAQAISPTDTSFVVKDASVFPDAPFRVTIDGEIMEVGSISKSRNTFSDIIRGVEGTVAASHDTGASVENRWTAGTLQILLDNIQTTFTRVVDGKRQLAAAIGDMNQSVSSDADFARLAAKIRDISKDATATPGYVARGETFYAGGRKQTGTYSLDSKPWRLITPTTSRINVSGGYYPNGVTVEGDSNLRSSNILSGKSIFGVRGNVHELKWAEGSAKATQPGNTRAVTLTVRNLSFRPLLVCVWYKYGGYSDWSVNQAILVDKAGSRFDGAKVLHAGRNDRDSRLEEDYDPEYSYIYNDGFKITILDTTFGVGALHDWLAIG